MIEFIPLKGNPSLYKGMLDNPLDKDNPDPSNRVILGVFTKNGDKYIQLDETQRVLYEGNEVTMATLRLLITYEQLTGKSN